MIYDNRQEKIALITGASRRIGACIAENLHTAGFTIIIHYHHSVQDAQELAARLNKKKPQSAHLVYADLRQFNAAAQLIKVIQQWTKVLHVVVNNASLFIKDEMLTTAQAWQDLFAVNVQAPYLISLAAAPLLEKERGLILNITDIHADNPLKNYHIYCQTKAALTLQTRALAKQLAPKIRVNAIAPGAIMWPENDNQLNTVIQEKIIVETPLKMHGDPQYIAHAILAFIENPFVTGQIIRVDGGRSII